MNTTSDNTLLVFLLLPFEAATVDSECMYGVSQRSITGLPMISRWVSLSLYPALASCQALLQFSPFEKMGLAADSIFCSVVVVVWLWWAVWVSSEEGEMCQAGVYIGSGMLTEHEPYNGLANIPWQGNSMPKILMREDGSLSYNTGGYWIDFFFFFLQLDLRYFIHNGKWDQIFYMKA